MRDRRINKPIGAPPTVQGGEPLKPAELKRKFRNAVIIRNMRTLAYEINPMLTQLYGENRSRTDGAALLMRLDATTFSIREGREPTEIGATEQLAAEEAELVALRDELKAAIQFASES